MDERDLSQAACFGLQRQRRFLHRPPRFESPQVFSPAAFAGRASRSDGAGWLRGFLGRGSAPTLAGLSETGGRTPTQPGTETDGSPSSLAAAPRAPPSLFKRRSNGVVSQRENQKRLERLQIKSVFDNDF